MAAIVLTLIVSLILAGAAWLLLGARFTLRADPEHNEVLNLVVYFAAILPVAFLVVFFLIERL